MAHERSSLCCLSGVAALGAWVIIVARAGAQDEGPIVLGQEQALQPFGLGEFRMALEGTARFHENRVRPSVGSTLSENEEVYREFLEVFTDAYIGHPNLVDLDLLGRFGLTQESIRSDVLGADERTAEQLYEYDVSALILRQSNAPFTAYSRRFETLIDRQFGESLDSMVMENGGRWLLRRPTSTTSMHYFHREEEQSSDLEEAEFDLSQDTIELHTQWSPAANQHFNLEYTFDDIQQGGTLRQTNDFERHNALATHVLDFGAANEHSLRSTLNYFNESGDLELDRLRWNEALRLRHTPRFETRYDTTVDWQERPDSEQRFFQGSGGFRHRLFESLVTSADVGASHLEILPDDFTSNQVFAVAQLDYRKRVPYGRIHSGLSIIANQQRDSDRGTEIQITDEQHVVSNSGLVVLNRRNIIPASIVVTDAAGIIFYSEGVDYTVQAFGDRVEIRRILGGSISDGQVLLIDYRLGPEPANTTTTFGIGVTVRYDFDESFLRGLGIYGRYFKQEQERTSDSPILAPADDIQDMVFGVDYNIGHLTLLAERQVHDSTLSPYEAQRAEARYTRSLGIGDSLVLAATYDEIDHTDNDVETAITNLSARWNSQLTHTLHASAALIWRLEHENPGVDVEAFEEEFELTWRHRQTTVFGSVRSSQLESDISESGFVTVQLGVRREF